MEVSVKVHKIITCIIYSTVFFISGGGVMCDGEIVVNWTDYQGC